MPRTTAADLLEYLFDGRPHPLEAQLTDGLASSRRFAAFISDARSKVRKKLRTAQDDESLADVALELETAYRLLQERAFSLEYEPKVLQQPRSPDFAVSFTTASTFMLEVTRLRANHPERLTDAVCAKLGQFVLNRSNVLLIGVPAPALSTDALRGLMQELQSRAERGDETLFGRFGLRDRSDFFSRYRRLSEVLLCDLPRRDETPTVWINPQAKTPLPSKVRTALHRSQTF